MLPYCLKCRKNKESKNPKVVKTSMVYKFFDKKTGGTVKSEITSNKELAGELNKPIIRKFERKEKYTHLLWTIFGVQLKQICN